ncbi:class F sortase [Streptomyces hypolithicus]
MNDDTLSGRPLSSLEGGRPRHGRHRRSRGRRIAVILTAAAGLALAGFGSSALVDAPKRTASRLEVGTLDVDGGPGGGASNAGSATARPTRLLVPAIGLDQGDLTPLRVQQDGRLGVPEDPGQVGWWTDGPRPGDPGAAVFVGHVDSDTGPGAFYGLSSLKPGDTVSVRRGDDSEVTFVVQALRQYQKDNFPNGTVYPTTGPPELRLITCAGAYDRTRNEYSDNVVVYATLDGTSEPQT